MLILGSVDITSLKKAFALLDAAIAEAKSDLEKRGAILYFENSYELAWKALRRTLIALGKDPLNNPRSVFREAADNNIIADPEQWFEFIDYRTKAAHTYHEQIIPKIFTMLPLFRDNLKDMIQRLETLQP
jgi:nucleotidyltransferase substrate binding protein (TIGR01987 family)